MQGELLAAVTGIIGLVLGIVMGVIVAGRFFRSRAEQLEPQPRQEGNGLPPGIAEVLSALPSSAVVLDSGDRVLRASSAARAGAKRACSRQAVARSRPILTWTRPSKPALQVRNWRQVRSTTPPF